MRPLGRDRLGRLVYVGDRVAINDVRAAVIERTKVWPRNGFRCVFEHDGIVREGICVTDTAIVDLEASPKHTNYERYFADLGTLDEIRKARDCICLVTSLTDCESGGCVFDNWCDSRTAFARWLEQEATL